MLRRTAIALSTMLVASLGWFGWLQASGNFHPIVAGQAYRAAQLDGASLRRWQRDHGIASVLNLRGENDGKGWYDDEIAATRDLGLTHIDFRMSASTALTAPEARQLIQIMRDAPKPILIHCKSGADRTGLAAALFVAGIAKGTEIAAEWQLSPRYGHVGLPWISAAWAMDETWESLEHELGFPHS